MYIYTKICCSPALCTKYNSRWSRDVFCDVKKRAQNGDCWAAAMATLRRIPAASLKLLHSEKETV